jgi:protoporphyrinogen oxidase
MQRLSEIQRACLEHPGLFLGGNYLSGVAIGDCIESGKVHAAQLEEYLLQVGEEGTKGEQQ